MEPERKLITAALLLAVAQQHPGNVKWLGVRPAKAKRLRLLIAEEARQFVASEAFEDMCEVAELNADALRAADPAVALRSFEILTDEKTNDSN